MYSLIILHNCNKKYIPTFFAMLLIKIQTVANKDIPVSIVVSTLLFPTPYN